MSRLDDTIHAKKEKRAKLEAAGVTVHPYAFAKSQSVEECRASLDAKVQTAGRIRRIRAHGKLVFVDLEDPSGKIQVMMRADEVGEKAFALLEFVDAGDFMGVAGKVGKSKTGEVTIIADSYTFLGKALRALPSEWNASDDKEVRFRQRYVDMLVNPDTRRVLDARWTILKALRRYLQDEQHFTEVETPVLQPLYGGTNAKPFSTHMNALDTDFYLRLAPELYLKRLIVGGYERIFEIARNFRNEGIDQTHQPEFTMIEWYEAYADYTRMMNVAEGLLKHLTQTLYGTQTLKVGDHEVNVGGAWPRIKMTDALLQFAELDVEKLGDEELRALLVDNQISLIGEFTRGKAIFNLFDHLVTKQLIQPTWITDYPKDVSPLAKQHRDNPDLVERFELYIGGKELMDGWSEITDPIDQRQRFENEQKRMRQGDDEAHPVDEDFLESMEYGMPPLGGIGVGIDRLVMFLTNTWSIREVIAFPTLRPLQPTHVTKPQEQVAKTTQAPKQISEGGPLPPRGESEVLLEKHVQNEALRHHCRMVARALEAYAKSLGEDNELWYQAGLLHDLDWEEHPDAHPNKAADEWLAAYPGALVQAIRAHAPQRTGVTPTTLLDKYLFACDELSGIMHAVSLMRPNGFADMETKSVKKKLKDKSFAANVSRTDIDEGMKLIGKTSDEHIAFLIEVFRRGATK